MNALRGKTALVTGGGTGVGQGIAFALAKEGADIAVVGRTTSKLLDTCAAIEKIGARALPITCDVCNVSEIRRTVAETISSFGKIDILVNNAQIPALGLLNDMTDERFENAFKSGPFATYYFMKACHPHMKANGGGVIVNLGTSLAQQASTAGYGAYVSAKQAVRGLTRAAACEWGGDGIRVNTIMPLAMSTAMDEAIKQNPEWGRALAASVPLGYIGDCERDIGRVVVFVAGEDARYITGATLPLDGGMANFG